MKEREVHCIGLEFTRVGRFEVSLAILKDIRTNTELKIDDRLELLIEEIGNG